MYLDTSQNYDEPVLACAFNIWVDIAAPRALVFHFLTDGQALSQWWATRCQATSYPGGTMTCLWRSDDRDITGAATFLRFEPPCELVWLWTHHNDEAIVLDGKGHRGMRWQPINHFRLDLLENGKTRVHLHDSGISTGVAFQELRHATQQGWLDAMTRLKRGVEQFLSNEIARQERRANAEKKLK